MEPFITLIAVTLGLRLAGALGVRPLNSWRIAVRGGLSAMFLLTGIAHFTPMGAEMVAMIPGGIPYPELLVVGTGLLELAGAIGLWVPGLTRWAATGLSLLLICIFPANVNLALQGAEGHDALLPRTLMQIVFLAAAVFVSVSEWRRWARHATRS